MSTDGTAPGAGRGRSGMRTGVAVGLAVFVLLVGSRAFREVVPYREAPAAPPDAAPAGAPQLST